MTTNTPAPEPTNPQGVPLSALGVNPESAGPLGGKNPVMPGLYYAEYTPKNKPLLSIIVEVYDLDGESYWCGTLNFRRYYSGACDIPNFKLLGLVPSYVEHNAARAASAERESGPTPVPMSNIVATPTGIAFTDTNPEADYIATPPLTDGEEAAATEMAKLEARIRDLEKELENAKRVPSNSKWVAQGAAIRIPDLGGPEIDGTAMAETAVDADDIVFYHNHDIAAHAAYAQDAIAAARAEEREACRVERDWMRVLADALNNGWIYDWHLAGHGPVCSVVYIYPSGEMPFEWDGPMESGHKHTKALSEAVAKAIRARAGKGGAA